MQSLPNEDASEDNWNSYFEDQTWSEYYVHKKDSDLMVERNELQIQRTNGRLVFNFSVYHAFQKKSDYLIQIVVQDHSGNRRALQAPISIERLKGLELRDGASMVLGINASDRFMKSFKLILMSLLNLSVGVLIACDQKSMTWQTGQPASIQKYYSPSPRYNLMAPSKSQLLKREISDLFLQEDQSDYALSGGPNTGVRTDLAIEDYFTAKFAEAGQKFQTYRANRDNINAMQASSGDMRPLAMGDVSNNDQIIAYYNLKMTGGLIFRTDQLKCATPYSHPMTMHEAFGMSNSTHQKIITQNTSTRMVM